MTAKKLSVFSTANVPVKKFRSFFRPGICLAGRGGDPVPMRQSEINRILGTVDELSEQPEEINIPYVVGESVKVTDGPFNGFTGVIEEVNNDKKRVKVIVKVFGRQTPLELSFMQVEKE